MSLFHWTNEMTDGWRSTAGGYRVLVLDLDDDPGKAHALLREPGSRPLYRDRDVAVIGR